MRIPVTGGGGFISSHDVRTLLADGDLAARAYTRTYRLNDCTIRCCNDYAPTNSPRR